MKYGIGYLRVSTREQGRRGVGSAAQRHEIERFASQEGLEVRSWHQDIQTGGGADALLLRPGLAQALKDAKSTRCPLIVSKLAGVPARRSFMMATSLARSACGARFPSDRSASWKAASKAATISRAIRGHPFRDTDVSVTPGDTKTHPTAGFRESCPKSSTGFARCSARQTPKVLRSSTAAQPGRRARRGCCGSDGSRPSDPLSPNILSACSRWLARTCAG
jgi:hypothetical protein